MTANVTAVLSLAIHLRLPVFYTQCDGTSASCGADADVVDGDQSATKVPQAFWDALDGPTEET